MASRAKRVEGSFPVAPSIARRNPRRAAEHCSAAPRPTESFRVRRAMLGATGGAARNGGRPKVAPTGGGRRATEGRPYGRGTTGDRKGGAKRRAPLRRGDGRGRGANVGGGRTWARGTRRGSPRTSTPTNYELRTANYELRTTNCELRPASLCLFPEKRRGRGKILGRDAELRLASCFSALSAV